MSAENQYLLGKLPPQAVEFEEAIIGALMLESKAMQRVSDILRPEMFYEPKYSTIYTAISEMYRENIPVDLLTVTKKLRAMNQLEGVGGPAFISQLTSKVASTMNIEIWSRVLVEKFMAREVIRISNDALRLAYSNEVDVFDLLDRHSRDFASILDSNVKGDAVMLHSLSKSMLDEVQSRQAADSFRSGLSTNIKTVDKILGGYKKTDLIYIAARPSMGKTGYILSNALEQARNGHAVVIFSIEMSKTQVMYRIASQITGLDLELLMNKKLDEQQLVLLNKALGEIRMLKIFIDDTPALSVYEFRSKCKRLKERYNVEVAYIDYLQLMTLGSASKKLSNNREQEISQISRTVKQTAKELEIPVIALCQLSRALESRGKNDRRPLLSDLRESGSLEQDADVVAFIYRPEYYGIDENANGETTSGYAEFIVAKHRNGRLGAAAMRFIDYMARFTNRESNSNAPHPDSRTTQKSILDQEEAPF